MTFVITNERTNERVYAVTSFLFNKTTNFFGSTLDLLSFFQLSALSLFGCTILEYCLVLYILSFHDVFQVQ